MIIDAIMSSELTISYNKNCIMKVLFGPFSDTCIITNNGIMVSSMKNNNENISQAINAPILEDSNNNIEERKYLNWGTFFFKAKTVNKQHIIEIINTKKIEH
jgi:hypothetical protein